MGLMRFDKESLEGSVGSIYCIGRNFTEHAKELQNPVPDKPLIFMKSAACLTPFQGQIKIGVGEQRCDYETELAVRLGDDGFRLDAGEALRLISHIGLALDLTLRDMQKTLKSNGHPWELSKNFINSCPLSPLQPLARPEDLDDLSFSLRVNGELRQSGNLQDTIFSVGDILMYLSHHVPLRKGDLILTGTPSGVGPLRHRDVLEVSLNGKKLAEANFLIE